MRKIFQGFSQILAEILSVSPDMVSPDTALSSLRYQELASAVIACEKTFHIVMEDERICDLKTAADWVDYIRERIADGKENAAPASEQERESWYYR